MPAPAVTIPVTGPIPARRLGEAQAEVLTSLGLTYAVKSNIEQAGSTPDIPITQITNIVAISEDAYNDLVAADTVDNTTLYFFIS